MTDTQTVNWGTMEAGRELDKLIAEKLGYTDLQVSDWTQILYGTRPTRPDDDPYRVQGGMIQEPICEYSTDTDAALTLIDSVKGDFHLQSPAPNIWQCWFKVPPVPQGLAETPAFAVCRAWLAWKESQP